MLHVPFSLLPPLEYLGDENRHQYFVSYAFWLQGSWYVAASVC